MKFSSLSWLHAAPVHGALTSESLKGMLLELTKGKAITGKATTAEAAPDIETTEAKEGSVEVCSAEAIKKIQRARKS